LASAAFESHRQFSKRLTVSGTAFFTSLHFVPRSAAKGRTTTHTSITKPRKVSPADDVAPEEGCSVTSASFRSPPWSGIPAI
jgi:hypothetical protein